MRCQVSRTAAPSFLASLVLLCGVSMDASASSTVAVDTAKLNTAVVQSTPAPAAAAAKARALNALAKLPMHFEPNTGRHPEAVQFSARGPGYHLFLNGNETVLTLPQANATAASPNTPTSRLSRARAGAKGVTPKAAKTASVLRIRFDGANLNPAVTGEQAREGKSHYFIGSDPAKWNRNVSHYGQVRYRSVYPGIDMVYYGHEGTLEYDWIVAPGADPTQIVEVLTAPPACAWTLMATSLWRCPADRFCKRNPCSIRTTDLNACRWMVALYCWGGIGRASRLARTTRAAP